MYAIRSYYGPLAGRLRLGVIPTIGPYFLPRVLPAVREAYPDLKLYLREDQTARLIDGLHGGRLDCGVLATPYDIGDLSRITSYNVCYTKLLRVRTIIFSESDNNLANGLSLGYSSRLTLLASKSTSPIA